MWHSESQVVKEPDKDPFKNTRTANVPYIMNSDLRPCSFLRKYAIQYTGTKKLLSTGDQHYIP